MTEAQTAVVPDPEADGKREYKFQISDKIGDIIFLARGDDLQNTVDDYLTAKDILTAAVPEPAASTRSRQVQRNNPGTSEVETCAHGDRQYKSGTGKNGSQWQAWDCPKRICDRKWVND